MQTNSQSTRLLDRVVVEAEHSFPSDSVFPRLSPATLTFLFFFSISSVCLIGHVVVVVDVARCSGARKFSPCSSISSAAAAKLPYRGNSCVSNRVIELPVNLHRDILLKHFPVCVFLCFCAFALGRRRRHHRCTNTLAVSVLVAVAVVWRIVSETAACSHPLSGTRATQLASVSSNSSTVCISCLIVRFQIKFPPINHRQRT